jgi:hypothetical protein
MAILHPKTGSKLSAAAAYFPQAHTAQGRDAYQKIVQWLIKLLNEEHPHQPVLLGGDLQATPLANHTSHYPPLEELCNTSLKHIGDPHITTYIPNDSPLDRWLLRLPPSALSHIKETTVTTTHTNNSDHRALTIHIPKIGGLASHSSPTPSNIPTTRNHPHSFSQSPNH